MLFFDWRCEEYVHTRQEVCHEHKEKLTVYTGLNECLEMNSERLRLSFGQAYFEAISFHSGYKTWDYNDLFIYLFVCLLVYYSIMYLMVLETSVSLKHLLSIPVW